MCFLGAFFGWVYISAANPTVGPVPEFAHVVSNSETVGYSADPVLQILTVTPD